MTLPKCQHGESKGHDHYLGENADPITGKEWCSGPQQAQPLTDDDDKAMALRVEIAKALRGAPPEDSLVYDLLSKSRNWLLIQWLEIQELKKDRMAQQAQPEMPTREQIAEALYKRDYPEHKDQWMFVKPSARSIYYEMADAVLALCAAAKPEIAKSVAAKIKGTWLDKSRDEDLAR